MWNNKGPTVQLLGRWQPWHPGHLALFKKAHAKTGQVCIMVRDVQGIDTNNPFDFIDVKNRIIQSLQEEEYVHQEDFIVLLVPNIVNITYGRDVGYSIEQEHLGEDIERISATEIRRGMNLNG